MSAQEFDLSKHNIKVKNILRNPAPATLYEEAVKYDKQAEKLGKLFEKNFEKYKAGSSEDIINAGPKVGVEA